LQRAAELDPGAGALVLSRDVVRLASHRGAADEATLQRLEQIRIRLERAGYEGMTEAALAEELGLGAEAQPLIALAARAQRLVRLPQQLLVAQAVWDDVVHRLRSEAAAGLESIEVATFKQLFQLTRRVAIPMLERLDDLGVTQRIGNARRVRRPAGHVDERVER
jgi:selenocysteine-specific elongation factor